jgi:hypothetical protein
MATGTGAKIGVRNNGVMTLLPGAPGSQPVVTMDAFTYEAAQVEDIVTNEGEGGEISENYSTESRTSNVGRAKIRFVNTDKGMQSKDLPWADPLFPYQSSYPLIGEYVLVFKALGTYYYIGPVNLKRKITHNAAPIAGRMQQQPTDNVTNLRNQRAAAAGVLTQASPNVNQVGTVFKELKVNPLKVFEGDVIFQGRYGNSIRFGSSKMIRSAFGEQHPNIILRAGQGPDRSRTNEDGGPQSLTAESINTDPSTIWMVSNQILGLIPATYGTTTYLNSLFEKPTAFGGASILINSDRLILNSKESSIFLFAKKGIHLNSLQDGITLDTAGPISLSTPNNFSVISDKTINLTGVKEDIIIATKRDTIVSGDRNIILYGNEIFLGGRSTQSSPVVLGRQLKLFLYELLRTFMSTSPLTIGPTGVVNPALIARFLVVFSKYMVLPDPFNPMWASNDTFAMKVNTSTMASDLPPSQTFKSVTGLGSRSSQDAYTTGAKEASNAGIKDLRRLYGEELISKL